MGSKTGISYADSTWNPVFTGCTKISDGCINCYAFDTAIWLKNLNNPRYVHAFETHGHPFVLTIHEDRAVADLNKPLKWVESRVIFLGSMYDIGHKDVPVWVIKAIWEVMNKASWHYFLVLTKRPHRLAARIKKYGLKMTENIGVGTTVEAPKYHKRLESLAEIPAKMHFMSAGPLLEDVSGVVKMHANKLDWVITEGESGAIHRPADIEWFKTIRNVCALEDIAFEHKQHGGNTKCKEKHVNNEVCDAKGCRLLDGKIYAARPPIIDRILAKTRPKKSVKGSVQVVFVTDEELVRSRAIKTPKSMIL